MERRRSSKLLASIGIGALERLRIIYLFRKQGLASITARTGIGQNSLARFGRLGIIPHKDFFRWFLHSPSFRSSNLLTVFRN